MKYIRTQVYLDAEEHKRLSDEAHARGISLAALIRELTQRGRVGEQAPPYGEGKSWEYLIGLVDDPDAEPTDIARFKDDYVAEAVDALWREKEERRGNREKAERAARRKR